MTIAGNDTAGCAFDSTFRMRAGVVLEPDPDEVVKFGIPFPSTITQTLTSGITGPPQSIVFDGHNNFFVGIPGATGTILEYDASGTLQHTFSGLPVDTSTFISLDINQAGTILYYTSGGFNIRGLDVPGGTFEPTIAVGAPITSFSITNSVVTFQATNTFTAGTTVTISGLSVGTYFNGQQLQILSTGLSGSAFEANVPAGAPSNLGSTHDTGTAALLTTTLFGLRVLTPSINAGFSGFLVAMGGDVNQITTSGNTGLVGPPFINGADGANNNWQALAFAPDGGEFWATNLANNGHLIEFNLSGGETTGNVFDTAASNDGGQSGVCVVGGFSAAQPTPVMKTFTLSPANNSNTFQFTTPSSTHVSLGNGVTGTSTQTNQLNETMVFVPNVPNSTQVKVTAWFIEIDSPPNTVGTSDPSNGSLPCLVVDSISNVNRCGVVKVEFNPDSPTVFSSVNFSLFTSESSVNPAWVSDEITTETTFIVDTGVGGTHHSTVYTLHEQPLSPPAGGEISCGYQNPITTSPSQPSGNTLPLKFGTAMSPADCRARNFLNSSTLMPTVSLVKLDPSGLTGTLVFKAKTAGGTSGPFPAYRFSPPSTWIININLSSIPKGCYIATTIDASNQIGSFSYSATTSPGAVLIEIGSHQCKGITAP